MKKGWGSSVTAQKLSANGAKDGRGWTGLFLVSDPGMADVKERRNDIQLAGFLTTYELWRGDDTEVFQSLRLVENGNTIATEPAAFSISTDPEDHYLQSEAVFPGASVTSEPDAVQLIGSDGTVLAEAALDPGDVPEGDAVLIRRRDFLQGV